MTLMYLKKCYMIQHTNVESNVIYIHTIIIVIVITSRSFAHSLCSLFFFGAIKEQTSPCKAVSEFIRCVFQRKKFMYTLKIKIIIFRLFPNFFCPALSLLLSTSVRSKRWGGEKMQKCREHIFSFLPNSSSLLIEKINRKKKTLFLCAPFRSVVLHFLLFRHMYNRIHALKFQVMAMVNL